MDGVELLESARAAGLEVHLDGDRLVIRGPKTAEPIARQLLRTKTVVLEAIQGRPDQGPCGWCRRRQRWISTHGVVVCGWCHPLAYPGLVMKWLDPKPN